LSRAARHLSNDMGACGTFGDVHSDWLPDILKKYYAFSVEELSYIIVEH
jgi:hypothetical protein